MRPQSTEIWIHKQGLMLTMSYIDMDMLVCIHEYMYPCRKIEMVYIYIYIYIYICVCVCVCVCVF